MASLFDRQDKHAEALKLREENLAIIRELRGEDHEETLKSKIDLAFSLNQVNRPVEAQKLLEQALPTIHRVFGPENEIALIARYNLATAHQLQKQWIMAQRHFEKLVALHRKVSGAEHPSTIACMRYVAWTLEKQGKHVERKKWLEEALAIEIRTLGPQHPDAVDDMNSLAWLLATSGDPKVRDVARAVQLAESAVAASGRTNHNCLDTLAAAYAEAGQFTNAVATQNEALTKLTRPDWKSGYLTRLKRYEAGSGVRDSTNPVAVQQAAVGRQIQVLLREGQFTKAESLARESLAILEKEIPDQFVTLTTRSLLGHSLLGQGRFAEAEPLLRAAFDDLHRRRASISKAAFPRFTAAYQRLLELYETTGQTEKAADLRLQSPQAYAAQSAREQLEALRQRFPAQDPSLEGSLVTLTKDFLEFKMFPEAEEVARETLRLREKITPDKWSTSNSRSVLGGILTELGKYADAEPLLKSGYDALEQRRTKLSPAGKACFKESMGRLVRFYEATDRPAQAAEWKQKLAEFEKAESEAKSAAPNAPSQSVGDAS